MNLKTKLTIGVFFLFLVILIFGVLGIFYINRLSSDAKTVLKANYESLVYDNYMLKALDEIPTNKASYNLFETNLVQQEHNITEVGEKEATADLRKNFNAIKVHPERMEYYSAVRHAIQIVNDLNQKAILHKNDSFQKMASNAIFWLTILFTILTLLSFTLVVNFPQVISEPIRTLSEGIVAISNKNYAKRIHLEQKDEFGELANAFNTMAQKLDDYENSNLAKIKLEKSRIETIINQMRDGIIGLDDKKHVLFLNAVAEKLLGLKEIETIGKNVDDIANKNDLMRTLLHDSINKELKIYADNKESYFNKDILNVNNNGEVIGQVIVLRNVTVFHELNEAKTNFIATVSHELKTPISSIKMSAQLLSDNRVGYINEEQSELVKSIADDSERLLKITSELLNMSQVETGNIQLKLQSVSPKNIVIQSVQSVQFKANQKNIDIKVSIPDNAPNIYADLEKTSWVLINFLTNAIKYSPEHDTIEVVVTPKTKRVQFSVKDSGKGIDPKYLSKIFDRYYKVPGTHDRSGTGLGLAISKEFIEAQGGTIMVESEIGIGSKFSFEIDSF